MAKQMSETMYPMDRVSLAPNRRYLVDLVWQNPHRGILRLQPGRDLFMVRRHHGQRRSIVIEKGQNGRCEIVLGEGTAGGTLAQGPNDTKDRHHRRSREPIEQVRLGRESLDLLSGKDGSCAGRPGSGFPPAWPRRCDQKPAARPTMLSVPDRSRQARVPRRRRAARHRDHRADAPGGARAWLPGYPWAWSPSGLGSGMIFGTGLRLELQKGLLQLLFSTGKTRHDGADRDFQDLRYFLVRIVL